MSAIIVEERSVVVPGEVLAEGMDYLPGDNTYREGDKIQAKILGLVSVSGRVLKITPLSGPYIPKIEDKIIGRVTDITMSGWRVETGTAYSAMMNVKDATTRFIKREEDLSTIIAIGDYLVVKIINVTSQNLIDLTMREPGLRKVSEGRILRINAQKVPRVIGKKASMITLLREKTGCDITIGQNGWVWVRGTAEGELLAEKALALIAEKSHLEGLTEKMEAFLNANAVPLPPRTFQPQQEQTERFEEFKE